MIEDSDDYEYVPVDYTPFNIQYPAYEPREFIAPGISYSPEVPEGYTVYDDVYDPFVYNPPTVDLYANEPPLSYDPIGLEETTKPSGYNPLDITNIQAILNSIGKNNG